MIEQETIYSNTSQVNGEREKTAELALRYSEIAKVSQDIAFILAGRVVGLETAQHGPDEGTRLKLVESVEEESAATVRPDQLDELTDREIDILGLLAFGLSNKEIAARLFVVEQTVKFHLGHVYRKLDVSNRTLASNAAHGSGLIEWARLTTGKARAGTELMAETKKLIIERAATGAARG